MTSSRHAAADNNFFKELPLLGRYSEISVPENFQPAPLDWQVVIADVVNSTGAIESGHYKNVNILGATTIIGLLNVAGAIEFPFVFGGDGASCLIPPTMLEPARRVLLAARNRAMSAFQLELRVGVVSVRRVWEDGFAIRVAKLRMSDRFAQAVFSGGGLSRAEELVKHPPAGERYELPSDPALIDADFSGLECRWNPVRSEKGEVVSLLIQARGADERETGEIYREVIREIESVFGSRGEFHPVTAPRLRLASRKTELMAELRAKHAHRPRWMQRCILFWMLSQGRVGNVLLGKRLRCFGVDWLNYKGTLIQNTDYQKFDDMIRMVLSCSTESRRKFERYLREQRDRGRLCYGLHVTDHALLTCLVFDRYDRHFHFVDGSNGGYALAAKGLKQQLRETSESAVGRRDAEIKL